MCALLGLLRTLQCQSRMALCTLPGYPPNAHFLVAYAEWLLRGALCFPIFLCQCRFGFRRNESDEKLSLEICLLTRRAPAWARACSPFTRLFQTGRPLWFIYPRQNYLKAKSSDFLVDNEKNLPKQIWWFNSIFWLWYTHKRLLFTFLLLVEA